MGYGNNNNTAGLLDTEQTEQKKKSSGRWDFVGKAAKAATGFSRRKSGSSSPSLSPRMRLIVDSGITLETLFEFLEWIGPHNALVSDKQMCGRITYETVDISLDFLHRFPVCIEIDICGKSKIIREPEKSPQVSARLLNHVNDNEVVKTPSGIYVDHYSLDFDNNTGNKRTGTYLSDKAYDRRLSQEFSIEAVLTHIKNKYEVKQRQERPLFPLMLSMDVSKISSKRSDKDKIFAYIEATFDRVFDKYRLFTDTKFQGSAATQPLRNLMGKVLLRINNKYGNVPKPDGASEKLKVKYNSGTDDIEKFAALASANAHTHFTRVYPPVFADMTYRELLPGAVGVAAARLSSSSPSPSPSPLPSPSSSPSSSPSPSSSTSSPSPSSPSSSPDDNPHFFPENGPEEDLDELIEKGAFDPFRLSCPETEHSRYTAISNKMVSLLIVKDPIFKNVNCVAFNWHDLTDQSKRAVVKHFTERYQEVVDSMSGATASADVSLLPPTHSGSRQFFPNPPQNFFKPNEMETPPTSPFANFDSLEAQAALAEEAAGGGKKRRKLKSRTKPKNKLIRKTRLIKRGGAKATRRVLKSKKNRKSIKNKRSKKNKSIKLYKGKLIKNL